MESLTSDLPIILHNLEPLNREAGKPNVNFLVVRLELSAFMGVSTVTLKNRPTSIFLQSGNLIKSYVGFLDPTARYNAPRPARLMMCASSLATANRVT